MSSGSYTYSTKSNANAVITLYTQTYYKYLNEQKIRDLKNKIDLPLIYSKKANKETE